MIRVPLRVRDFVVGLTVWVCLLDCWKEPPYLIFLPNTIQPLRLFSYDRKQFSQKTGVEFRICPTSVNHSKIKNQKSAENDIYF